MLCVQGKAKWDAWNKQKVGGLLGAFEGCGCCRMGLLWGGEKWCCQVGLLWGGGKRFCRVGCCG